MNKKLFAFDLDGTLLSDSKDATIPDSVKDVVKKLKEQGHIVCLFTGRPWRASQKVYEELELDTIVVNFNGGHIHHPKVYNFVPIIEQLPVSYAMRIIESKELQMVANNIVVEGPQFIHIKRDEKSFFTDTFIKTDADTKLISPIKYHRMTMDPTGVLIEVKKEFAENIKSVKEFFNSKYGDMAEFSYWETGKDNLPILEFTNFKARKDIALIRVARYYDIKMSDTIAFGDGFNDVQMLKKAGLGVAMANASDAVKSYANVVSKHTNKDGGVAKFINWYLDRGYKTVHQTIYSIGKVEPHINQMIDVESADI